MSAAPSLVPPSLGGPCGPRMVPKVPEATRDPARLRGRELGETFCKAFLTPEFFSEHWEKRPLHLSAKESGSKANGLPDTIGPDDLASIIRSSGPSLKIFRSGEAYDLDNFLIAYLDGASLIVNQAERHHPVLFELCRVLGERHFHHIFAVAYLTPPNAQAVRLHNDDQDVFLMQVWGKKRWTVRNAPKLLPYTEEMLGKEKPVPPEVIGDPVLEFTMEPHDVLYIPRGYLHEAATGEDEPSLHITVTAPTSDYCWGVQLTKHLLTKVHTREVPRELIPVCGGFLSAQGKGDSVALEGLEDQLQQLLQSWLSDLKSGSVLDCFEQRMARANEGQERAFTQVMEEPSRPCVTEKSRVRLMHGVSCSCEDGMAVFGRAGDGQQVELPITPAVTPLVQNLSDVPQWVESLPCKDRFQRLCLLQLLHQQGLLQLFLLGPDEQLLS